MRNNVLKLSACLLLLLISTRSYADSTDNKPMTRLEVLMNVSNTLSRFTGNGTPQTLVENPFLFGLKITNLKKTMALRIGVNFNINESSDNNSGIEKTSTNNSWAPLVGFEWRKKLGHKFEFYGGIDARYYSDINQTKTTDFTSSSSKISVFRNSQTGWGVGPFCGFAYNITPRVSLLTEGNFYLNFINLQRKFSSDGSNFDVFENRDITSITPIAPSSLFIVIKI